MLKSNNLGGTILLFACFFSTTVFFPKSFDPVSVPKSFVLIGFTLAAVVMMYWHKGFSTLFSRDYLDVLVILMIIVAAINLSVNRTAFDERLFGVAGRSLGFLSILICSTVLLLVRRANIQINETYKYILAANLFVCFVFVAQYIGFEIGRVQDFYGAPSSTLGNPNFVSGFLGFSMLASIAFLWDKFSSGLRNLSIMFLSILNIWVIYETKSVQGFFALAISFFIFGVLELPKVGYKRLLWIFWLTVASCVSLLVVGLLGRGPFASIFYASSVFSRLDYWRAAALMTWEHPFFGIGLDAYGDFYRKFRDQNAFQRFGENQVSDSPHNFYLDFFSGGGIPLGALLLLMNVIPLFVFWRQRRKTVGRLTNHNVLIATWFGFQAQALISPFQIGVNIWIWLLLGIMCPKFAMPTVLNMESIQNLATTRKRIYWRLCLLTSSSLILYLSFLPLHNNVKFLVSANSADGIGMRNAVLSFPKNTYEIGLVSKGFEDSGLGIEALEILRKGVTYNPNSFFLWRLIYENKFTTEPEKFRARQEMRRLDPRYVFTP